jgi:hypothetical protein
MGVYSPTPKARQNLSHIHKARRHCLLLIAIGTYVAASSSLCLTLTSRDTRAGARGVHGQRRPGRQPCWAWQRPCVLRERGACLLVRLPVRGRERRNGFPALGRYRIDPDALMPRPHPPPPPPASAPDFYGCHTNATNAPARSS